MPETRERELVHVRIDPEAVGALREQAAGQQTTVAELIRGIVDDHLAGRAAGAAWPEIERRVTAVVARETERVFSRHVNRLASMLAKTFIAAAEAHHGVRAVLEMLPEFEEGHAAYKDLPALDDAIHAYAIADLKDRRHTDTATEPADDAPISPNGAATTE